MSLIASASPWIQDDDTAAQKKRTPTLRKTVKRMPTDTVAVEDSPPPSNNEAVYRDVQGIAMQPLLDTSQGIDRTSRVNQLIQQMANVNTDNDGGKLADFQPLSPPQMQKRLDMQPLGRAGDPAVSSQYNPLQVPPPVIRQQPGSSTFLANTPDLGKVASNYNMIYQPSHLIRPPTGTNSESPLLDNRLMEKINYMIHLLEQQHNEKTSNITEEFVLYTFLGVFIIFIVDSFARAGKYTR